MAWTVQPDGYKYLAGTGSLDQMLAGSYLQLLESTTIIATCSINGTPSDPQTGIITCTWTSTPAVAGSTGLTAAKILDSTQTKTYLTTNDVSSGGDIDMGVTDSVISGNNVAPGTLTLSMVGLTLTKTP